MAQSGNVSAPRLHIHLRFVASWVYGTLNADFCCFLHRALELIILSEENLIEKSTCNELASAKKRSDFGCTHTHTSFDFNFIGNFLLPQLDFGAFVCVCSSV